MTESMKPGCYKVEDKNQGSFNGSIIHITEIHDNSPEDTINSRRIVKGTIKLSKTYNNNFKKAAYKVTGGNLGDNAYVFNSTDNNSILFTCPDKGIYIAKIVRCPEEGGRRRKTVRNKRKLRVRKTKSSNKRR